MTAFGSGVDQAVKRIGRTYEVRGMLEKITSFDHATVGQGSIVNEVQHVINGMAAREEYGLEQYVWDISYVDAPLIWFRDSNVDGTVDDTMYAAHDANFNVTALIDTAGTVQERYVYDPYGQRTILDGSWGARSSSSCDWMLGHQGLMLDGETGLYYNRARMLHPTLGRFVQRDPAGYVTAASLYAYLVENPCVGLDPERRQAATNPTAEPSGFLAVASPKKNLAQGWTDLQKWLIETGTSVDGCPAACEKIHIEEKKCVVEYAYSDSAQEEHELLHVSAWRTGWRELLGKIEPMTGICWKESKVACYRDAIRLYVEAFKWQAGADSTFVDVLSYRDEKAKERKLREYESEKNTADTKMKEADKKLADCETME